MQRVYLRRLVEAGLIKKRIFGSDQFKWAEVIRESIDLINGAEFLTKSQKADIFYGDGARFLRLIDGQIALRYQLR